MDKSKRIIYVNARRVNCDGGEGIGHPRIHLEMGDKDEVECPYCGAIFQYDAP